jgi:hypothetical protein
LVVSFKRFEKKNEYLTSLNQYLEEIKLVENNEIKEIEKKLRNISIVKNEQNR